MRPFVLLHLYRVRLRSRLGAELLAIGGIGVGVALVFAGLTANASLTGAVRQLSEGLVGKADFQLAARSASGFDQSVLARLDAIPGATAAPVAEARVNLVGSAGRRSVLLVGGSARSARLGGDLLASLDPKAGAKGLLVPRPLAEGLGVRPGQGLTVESSGGVGRARVAATLDRDAIGALADSPVALAPLPLVQRLAGMRGRISRIFVGAAPARGAAVLASLQRIASDRLNLGPADEEVALFERAARPTRESTGLFSALSALVGFLFSFSVMLLTVPQRARLVADLRMAGYTPVSTALVLLIDALTLGVLGAAFGLLLGGVASAALFGSVPDYLTSAFAIGSQTVVTWQSAALAAAAGVAAACLAVLVPVWSALRGARPSPAKARPGTWWPILAGGLVLLAISISLAPRFGLVAMATLLLSLLLLLGPWLRLVAAAFGGISRRMRSPAALLAAFQLQSRGARTRRLALAATGAVAVFATVSIGGARADLERGLDGVAADLDRGADVWIAFRGPANIFGTAAYTLPAEQMRQIEALPGVQALSRNRGSFLDVGHDRAWVLAPGSARVPLVLPRLVEKGETDRAVRRIRRGGWVALSEGLAADLGVGIGDRVDLPLPQPRPLKVAALTDNLGWPGGAVVMSAPQFRRAWGESPLGALGLGVRPGVAALRVVEQVRSILGRGSPLRVESRGRRLRRQRASARAGLSRLTQIAVLVLVASALAMGASMAGLVWQQRPAFAALKVQGLSDGELWRALLLEAVLLLGAAALCGSLFGLTGQVLLDRTLRTITGFPLDHQMAGRAAAGVLLGTTVAAVAVLALPGWLAVRVDPGVDLREE